MPDPVHVRTQVCDRGEELMQGPHAVFVGLSWPTPEQVLPCYMLFTPSEQVSTDTMRPSRQVRPTQFKVFCRDQNSDEKTLRRRLDAMAAYAEERLLVFDNWNGLIQRVELISTVVRVEAVGKKKGEAELTFIVEYATIEAAPHVAV